MNAIYILVWMLGIIIAMCLAHKVLAPGATRIGGQRQKAIAIKLVIKARLRRVEKCGRQIDQTHEVFA